MKVKTSNNTVLELADKPLASGGQGGIYEIKNSSYRYPVVVKIYHKPEAAKAAQKKIEYMVRNNPFKFSSRAVQESFAWPLEAIYDYRSNKFIGYLMGKIENALPLWHLVTPKGFKERDWLKFNLDNPDAILIRLKLLYNVCQALKVLDDSGDYQVIDLKPINMMLKNQGHMVIIDTDSFQIGSNSKVLFYAEAATAEYCPPEFHKGQVNFQKTYVRSSWDYFAFGVLAYQVLFCIHPFTGTHPVFHTQEDLIREGIWAYGSRSSKLKTPPPHDNFKRLSNTIQGQFRKSFDGSPSDRPDYASWIKVLLNEIEYVGKNKVVFTTQLGKGKRKSNPVPKNRRPVPPQTSQAVIRRFQIKPGVLANNAMLEWEVLNAARVLVDGKTVASSGQMLIPATIAKRCEIKAIDAHGLTSSRQVSYTPDLTISNLNYQVYNGYITIHWTVNGGVNEVFLNGVKQTSNVDKISIPLGQVKSVYELQVLSAGGYHYIQKLGIQPLVSVEKFEKTLERSTGRITWKVVNAALITLNSKTITSEGSTLVSYETGVIKLKAWDTLGNVVEKTLSMDTPVPQIKTFGVSCKDYSAELKWDVWFAKSVWIDGQKVELFGSRRLPLFSTTFELSVLDFKGKTTKRTLAFDAPKLSMRPIASIRNPGKAKSLPISKINDKTVKIKYSKI